MRIALVTVSFLPHVGGAEYVVHHLAQQWQQQGHEVCVINRATDRPTEPGATYEVMRYNVLRGTSRLGAHRSVFAAYAARQIRAALDKYNPDVISAHFGYPTGIWLARLRPVPRFVITCHGPALNETASGPRQRYGIDKLVADALNASTCAIAISTHAREIMERIGVEPTRIAYVPNGADLGRFNRRVAEFDLRRAFGIPAGAPVVLSVGRESWAKAYEIGIKAFAEMLTGCPDAYYVILGKGTGRWLELAAKLGIAERVICRDGLYGDELVAAYQQADVFFLPSKKELCPVVIPEAMAAGLPLVVTNISGSQDMVVDGENGYVVPPGDSVAMATKLALVLGDTKQRTSLADRSRELSSQYSWDRISRRYLELALGGVLPHP